MKICFLRQSWTKSWKQIHEIKQNRVFFGMFYSWFCAIFYQDTSKFGYWVDGWVLAIKSKYFRDFPKIFYFPKVLRLTSFGNLWRNSYIHFLVIFTFTFLVPFNLWWREIVLKSEKVYNCFVQDCTL